MKSKRLLAMLMTGVLTAGMFSATAFAEEGKGTTADEKTYVPADTYVLNYGRTGNGNDPQDIQGYSSFDSRIFWYTPYRTNIWVDEEGVLANWNYCTSCVMNMIDLSAIDKSKEATDAYASVPVYCVDAITNSVETTNYQRVNLEDATHFDDVVAGRVRAIIINSFPKNQPADIAAKVNQWIAENDLGDIYEEVQNLNHYEVISATQAVIWTLTNDGKLNDDVYVGYAGYVNEKDENWYATNCIYNDIGEYGENEYTDNNINALARYFEALDPMEPQGELISEASFEYTDATGKLEADGTYTYTVKATVNAVVDDDDKDDLTLTAVVDGEVAETAQIKNGANNFEFEFNGLKQDTIIKLAIDGVQLAGDVYLFDPVGGRRTSQSMAGYYDSALPVHAEVVLRDRIINFDKSTKIDNETYPLDGIAFEIYYAGTVDDYTAWIELNKDSVVVEDENSNKTVDYSSYAASAMKNAPVATVTTDITGKASYNLTDNKQPDGVYVIVEKDHPAIVKPLDPFLITVPMTTADGSSLAYTINLEPKNKLLPAPGVRKDVTSIENDEDSFDANVEHTWIIRGEIPVDLANAKEYIITDELDYRLTYKDGMVVAVEKESDGAYSVSGNDAKTLEKGIDYVVRVSKGAVNVSDGEDETIDKFEVELTDAGMEKVARIAGKDYADYEVRVYFKAVIDEDASMGVEIPNQAKLIYTNSVNFKYETESDKPVVYTCGINIYKHDAKDSDVALAGAKFKLAKVVDQGTDGATPLVTKDGTKPVVYEEFYDIADLTGEKVSVVTTTDNGAAVIYGLEEGEYYLVEIQAPSGYNLLSYPVAVTLDKDSHLAENVVDVANSNTFKLPETGGIGTTIFTVGGVLLITAAVVILIVKKKKENEAEAEN